MDQRTLAAQGKHAYSRRRESASDCLCRAPCCASWSQADGSGPQPLRPQRRIDCPAAAQSGTRPGARTSGSTAQSLIAEWFLLPSYSQNQIQIRSQFLSQLSPEGSSPRVVKTRPPKLLQWGGSFLKTLLNHYYYHISGQLQRRIVSPGRDNPASRRELGRRQRWNGGIRQFHRVVASQTTVYGGHPRCAF